MSDDLGDDLKAALAETKRLMGEALSRMDRLAEEWRDASDQGVRVGRDMLRELQDAQRRAREFEARARAAEEALAKALEGRA